MKVITPVSQGLKATQATIQTAISTEASTAIHQEVRHKVIRGQVLLRKPEAIQGQAAVHRQQIHNPGWLIKVLLAAVLLVVIRNRKLHRVITRRTGQAQPTTEVQAPVFHREATAHLQVQELTEEVRLPVQEVTAVEVQVAEEAAGQLIRAVRAVVHTRVAVVRTPAAEVPVAAVVVLQVVDHHHRVGDNFRIQI